MKFCHEFVAQFGREAIPKGSRRASVRLFRRRRASAAEGQTNAAV